MIYINANLFLTLKSSLLLFCLCFVYVCVYVHPHARGCLQRPEDGIGSSRAAVAFVGCPIQVLGLKLWTL